MIIKEPGSRNLVRLMIFISWLSFVASVWLAHYDASFLFSGLFWLITAIILAAFLGATKK